MIIHKIQNGENCLFLERSGNYFQGFCVNLRSERITLTVLELLALMQLTLDWHRKTMIIIYIQNIENSYSYLLHAWQIAITNFKSEVLFPFLLYPRKVNRIKTLICDYNLLLSFHLYILFGLYLLFTSNFFIQSDRITKFGQILNSI